MATNNITGIRELQQMLERGRRAPAKVLTVASKKGANIVRQAAKADAPKDTGKLKRSIKLKAEKRIVGKKIYQIKFIGDNLAKISQSGNRSFYPASQEYGWKKKDGSKHPGKHFMKHAIQLNKGTIEQTIINELTNSLRALGW